MKQENNIVKEVYAAQKDREEADALLRRYLPFIKAEAAKFLNRPPREGEDDELNVAMFAFHEAVLSYSSVRGAFFSFAALAIRHRLIDYYRKERRHTGIISLNSTQGEEEERELIETIGDKTEEIEALHIREAAREEIMDFAKQLKSFELELSDIAENCPKQKRTLAICHKALTYAKNHGQILETLVSSKKLPIKQLADGCGVSKKTLERHRKYMIAILLAYTNGFEIIRNHLCQVVPQEGEEGECVI